MKKGKSKVLKRPALVAGMAKRATSTESGASLDEASISVWRAMTRRTSVKAAAVGRRTARRAEAVGSSSKMASRPRCRNENKSRTA